ncbi:branched-chain amino acid aminotransferase [Phenylobacterium sp.]|jgi:branched-chain amino acid aminotransferase|uniref:branched-chain amino acid aminotransferase n=1 Tax=Phenylobacterium sp. TaxID=1871053 RepID=UPI002E31F1F0|nr:branched-chain amino acid aminotransferase [Phenylobacterium sp.]HEX3363845.1 branched-chain amino acid aminotransferase [Phenylobacterium sp.]
MSLVPFDDRDGWIWLDGQFVPWREATVHVLTHGLHYASAVFEGERMYGGEIFELTAHTERLFKSAEILDFQIPFTVAQIDQACKDTCAKNGLADAYLRPIAWRGSEMIGVSAQNTKIHVAIACWDWPSYFTPEAKAKGIRMCWAKYKRPSPETEPVHAKAAGLYMICTISKHAAEKDGYTDAMMLDYRGYVAESTGSNVFFIKDGVIHTPIPDCFLNGITRQSLIKLARSRGFEVIERHIRPEELSEFSECFVTGSAAEVTPVSEIGEYRFTPGNISLSLADDYSKMVRRELVSV